MNRRLLIELGGAVGGAAAVGGIGLALLRRRDAEAWAAAIDAQRQALTPAAGSQAQRELIRYATLAASSNTQPWLFAVTPETMTIAPDLTRRCPVVDPDDHHLFASLGCAVENLVQAAPLVGLRATAEFNLAHGGSIGVRLEQGSSGGTALAAAIPRRQCTRTVYDSRPVPLSDLHALEAAVRENETEAMIITDRSAMDDILALIVEGNTRQIGDPAFVAELKQWIRFSYGDALASGDGLFAAASGNPVLPHAVGSFLFDFVFDAEAENTKATEQVRSSAGLAVFVSQADDNASRVEAGRAYQRFALTATSLGIRHAFLNQAVEVSDVRRRLADHLGIGERRPNFVVRFGYGPEMPMSLRRPVDDVLI
jgi:hypothetical protein